MATSLSVSEETRDEIQMMKIKGGYPSVDALLRDLLIEHKKKRLMEISIKFRKRMDERGLKVEDLFK